MTSAVTQFTWLTAAALLFSWGGLCMYWSVGLTRGLPTAGVFACFGVGAACQAMGMRGSAMSTIYVIVLGLEAITAFALGAIFLGESITWHRLAALVLIVAGIAWLRTTG